MKKIISLLLIISLAIFTLSCGDKTKGSSEDNNTEKTTKDNSKDKVDKTKKTGGDSIVFPEIKEQVIYDENDVKITVKASKSINKGVGITEIPISIHNNSKNTLNVKMANFRINGITLYYKDSLFRKLNMAPGQSTDAKIYLNDDDFKMLKIKELGDIVLDIKVDSKELDKPFEKKDVEIVTSLSGKVKQEISKEGKELINQDGILLIVREKLYKKSLGPALEYYFENNSDTFVKIEMDGTYLINGVKVDSPFWIELDPNRKTITREFILEGKITEAGVKMPIKTIEYKIRAKDKERMGNVIIKPIEVKLDF